MTTDRKRGYLYILLAAMLYSTTEVALKALGGAFAPMQVTVERVLLGAAALMPFALNDLKKRDIQLTKADWGYFTLLGFLTVTLHMSLLQMAVLHMDASATSIIYSGNPVFAVALAHFILHEPLKKNHLLAIGVELVGILFILNPAHLEISLRGFLEIITATLLFATYGTLCKLRLPRLGALVITTFNMLIGGLELLFLLMLVLVMKGMTWCIGGVCDVVKKCVEKGVQIGIVVGGGNFWRGLKDGGDRMERTRADHMGMLATCINALAVADCLEQRGVAVRVQTAIAMNQIAEPYIRSKAIRHLEKGRVVIFACGTGNPFFSTDTGAVLRAAEINADAILLAKNIDGVYSADPAKDPTAVRYDEISYDEVLAKHLAVMDSTATSLSMDNHIPVQVFALKDPENILRVVMGEKIGTIVKEEL